MSATSTTGAAPAAAVAPVVTHIQEPHIELSKLPVFTPTAVETLLEQTGHSGTAYDPAIADLLNNVSAHFISTLMTQAAFLTKHRRSDTVEPRDLQVVLAKYWGNATVPGHSPFRSSLHAAAAERARVLSESAHAVRLATRNGTALGQTAQTHIALSHASALHAARAEAVVRAQPSIREGLADYDQAAAGAAEDAAAAGAGAAGAKGGAGGKGGSKVARYVPYFSSFLVEIFAYWICSVQDFALIFHFFKCILWFDMIISHICLPSHCFVYSRHLQSR